MQTDGNFVVYTNGQAKWASNTNGQGTAPFRLLCQDDGNLVVYDTTGRATWASNTNGWGDGAHMVMQDDGELAMFNGNSAKMWSTNASTMEQLQRQRQEEKARHLLGWKHKKELQQGQSLTSPNGSHTAMMQTDGNFVVYTNGQAKWASNTNGQGTAPYRLVCQDDGNLVVYDTTGRATWATGTNGYGDGAHMVMQDDGELAMFDSSNGKMWSSNASILQQIITTRQERKERHLLGWKYKKELQQGQSLTSSNGQHIAAMQTDGNFVVYTNGQAKWASNTNGQGTGPFRLLCQDDGNLVVYDATGRATWASGTNGHGDGAHMVMQDDGELAMFDSGDGKMWSTNASAMQQVQLHRQQREEHKTRHLLGWRYKPELQQGQVLTSPNGHHTATMQTDGNFVVYTHGQAKWASNTNGKGTAPYRLVMQGDGNLVVYDKNNQATWAAGTNGRGDGAHMVMQDDGELAMYDSLDRKMWTTRK